MLTGKTSVLIDTQKSDDDALPPDDTNQTIDSSIMDRKTEDGDDGADDCKNKQEKNKQSGVTKAVERSKFGKFIIHYGMSNFSFAITHDMRSMILIGDLILSSYSDRKKFSYRY